jgi:hypothetical protein
MRYRNKKKNTISKLSDIRVIATKIREKLSQKKDIYESLFFSRSLRDRLKGVGYTASVVIGKFRIDHPNNKIRKNVKRKDFDDDEDFVIAKHEPLHFWVLVDETIHVDITADQFSPECNECFKKDFTYT